MTAEWKKRIDRAEWFLFIGGRIRANVYVRAYAPGYLVHRVPSGDEEIRVPGDFLTLEASQAAAAHVVLAHLRKEVAAVEALVGKEQADGR